MSTDTARRSGDALARSHHAQVAVQAHLESSRDLPTFFGLLTETIAHLVGARMVAFSVLDGEGRSISLQHRAFGFGGDSALMRARIPVDPEGDDLASRIVFGDRAFRAGLEGDDPELASYRSILEMLGVSSGMAVGWRAGDRPLGLVSAFDSIRGGFDEEDVWVLRTAAQAAGAVWMHKQAERRLEQLYEEARDSARAMDAFVNMMVHELRMPLTVVMGYVQLAFDGALGDIPEPVRQALGTVMEKSEEIRMLVEDMLLAARVAAGEEPIATQEVDLRDAVAQAAQRAEPRAELVRGVIDVDVPDRPVMVRADPRQLARILDNLAGNALIYGGPSPRVVIAAVPGEEPAVRVIDEGRGVPADMRESIFERFVRVEEPEGPGGTGLGLYISRQLAEGQGASLFLERSEPGEGSTFMLRFPATPPIGAAAGDVRRRPGETGRETGPALPAEREATG